MTTPGTPHPSSTPHSHWPLPDALRRAHEALRLYSLSEADLAAVVAVGWKDRVTADVAMLSGETRVVALDVQKTATADKLDVAAEAHDLVMLVRDVVVGHHAASALRTALGVGDQVHAADAARIEDHLRAIGAHRDQLLAGGVPLDAIDEAAALLAALTGKHDAQVSATGARHSTSESREAAQLRLEAHVKELARVGALKFRKDPVRRGLLRALMTHEGPATTSEPEAATRAPATPGTPTEGTGA